VNCRPTRKRPRGGWRCPSPMTGATACSSTHCAWTSKAGLSSRRPWAHWPHLDPPMGSRTGAGRTGDAPTRWSSWSAEPCPARTGCPRRPRRSCSSPWTWTTWLPGSAPPPRSGPPTPGRFWPPRRCAESAVTRAFSRPSWADQDTSWTLATPPAGSPPAKPRRCGCETGTARSPAAGCPRNGATDITSATTPTAATNLGNATLLCGYHHRWVHDHRLTATISPEGKVAWDLTPGSYDRERR